MFDMLRHSGENAGYELRISYNKHSNKYFVSGFVIHQNPINNDYTRSNYVRRFDRDGASLQFNSLEEAIKHITDYPESLKKMMGL